MAEQHGKALVPQIRFAGFTDPWEQRKLGDIVGIYDGVHQTPNYQNSGVMFLSVENIATLKSSKFISEEDFKRDYKVFPQENDILMTRIGDVGTTNVVTDNGLKAFYVSLALLKYKSTDPYFLSNAIQSDYVQKGLANRTLKTAIPMKINKDEIGKVSVMLPVSATEQQQIGTYFRNLDNLITLHQRKYDKLCVLKKSMLDKMFPKGGSLYPEIRFAGFTDPWEQRKLGDIVGIYDGVHQTPNYQNSGVMFLSVENIATLKSSKFISEEDFKRDYKVFPQENDILMTRIGDVGTTNVVTDNGLKAFYVSLALLKYKSTDPYFLSNAIQSDYVQKGLANRTLKTAIPMKINKDEIGKVSVMLPVSATEQQQIGTYFRNLDNLITLHQRKLELLRNIKKSMLDKMFV